LVVVYTKHNSGRESRKKERENEKENFGNQLWLLLMMMIDRVEKEKRRRRRKVIHSDLNSIFAFFGFWMRVYVTVII